MLSGQGLSSLIVLMWHCGERSERGSDGHRARTAASDRLRTLFLRHPGLDPGSITALKSWTPDQVRGDERAERTPASHPQSDLRHCVEAALCQGLTLNRAS